MKFLFLFINIISFFGCSSLSRNNFSYCEDNRFFTNSLTIDIKRNDEDTAGNFVFYSILDSLNRSNYLGALNQAKSYFNFKEFKYNGFKGIMPLEKKGNSFWKSYIAYRLSSFNDDLDKNSLYRIIVTNYQIGIENEDSNCVKSLFDIEASYLSCFLVKSKDSSLKRVERFKRFLFDYPSSKRVKYLLADLALRFSPVDSAVSLFKELYNVGYYQMPILKILTNYYEKRNEDSLSFYLSEINRLNPSECSISRIYLLVQQKNKDGVEKECQKCINGYSRKDSMKAKLLLLQVYVNDKNIKKGKDLYGDYENANSEFVLDEFKIWERGEYYDLMLRCLFLQEKYGDMHEFVFKSMGYNEKIKINNEQDFYLLIKKYFAYYNDGKLNDFDGFYIKNFQ